MSRWCLPLIESLLLIITSSSAIPSIIKLRLLVHSLYNEWFLMKFRLLLDDWLICKLFMNLFININFNLWEILFSRWLNRLTLMRELIILMILMLHLHGSLLVSANKISFSGLHISEVCWNWLVMMSLMFSLLVFVLI